MLRFLEFKFLSIFVLTNESMRSLLGRNSFFISSISLGNVTAKIVPNYNDKPDFCTFGMILNVNELGMLLPVQIILVHYHCLEVMWLQHYQQRKYTH